MSGAPYYPSYMLDPSRDERYTIEAEGVKYINNWHFRVDGSFAEEEKRVSDETIEIFSVGLDEYNFIALLSDGALSFSELIITPTSKTTKAIGPEQVIPNLLNFKQPKGEFVHRSSEFWLRQAYKKNISHHDDVSIAALWVGG